MQAKTLGIGPRPSALGHVRGKSTGWLRGFLPHIARRSYAGGLVFLYLREDTFPARWTHTAQSQTFNPPTQPGGFFCEARLNSLRLAKALADCLLVRTRRRAGSLSAI
jgi:hypothetical protein